jgi:hypothetical protein
MGHEPEDYDLEVLTKYEERFIMIGSIGALICAIFIVHYLVSIIID